MEICKNMYYDLKESSKWFSKISLKPLVKIEQNLSKGKRPCCQSILGTYWSFWHFGPNGKKISYKLSAVMDFMVLAIDHLPCGCQLTECMLLIVCIFLVFIDWFM